MKTQKVRVLIVDDSAMIRTMLTRLLATDPEIEVVGTAADPYIARDKLVQLKPDVMTLDIEMPKMDGISFLEKVMQYFPVRTIIISSLTSQSATIAFRALEVGAIDVMTKPTLDVNRPLEEAAGSIIQRVKAVARARLPHRAGAADGGEAANGAAPTPLSGTGPAPAESAGEAADLSKPVKIFTPKFKFKPSTAAVIAGAGKLRVDRVVAIAASTGGTEAIKSVLTALPENIPPIVIVQHMPPVYSKYFATALQKICPFEVREAEQGDQVLPNRVLIAPGDYHMEVHKDGGQLRVRLNQEPLQHGVRPAADILLKSVAEVVGERGLGVVLTGMGKDGALGLLAMRQAGGFCIAQDEESSVVFGMPKEAARLGAAHAILSLEDVAVRIIAECKVKSAA